MNEIQNKNIKIDIVWVEILKDFWCYVYIEKSLEHTKNIHANNYVSLFLKTLAPVLGLEIANMLEKANSFEFFVEGKRKLVYEERQRALKEAIVKSSRLPVAEQSMELSFREKVYDIRIKVHNGDLLDMNYETILDDIQSNDFWNALLSSPKRVLQAICSVLLERLGFEINIKELFENWEYDIVNTAKSIDDELSGEWFSYSIYKLFSKVDFLKREDKILIMYRYRMVTSILKIEKIIYNNKHEFFINFLRKWKAVVIDIIWNELSNLSTEFSEMIKQEIELKIEDKSFFPINRRLRNNIHYEKFDLLSESELLLVDKYQAIYFDIIINAFNSVLFVDIDDECKTMTKFVETCQEKGISQQDLFQNYEKYYRHFLKYKTI